MKLPQIFIAILSITLFFGCEDASSGGTTPTNPSGIQYETDFTLLSGQEGTATLAEGDTHTWTFTASEGDYIAITAGNGNQLSPIEPRTELKDPSGSTIDSTNGGRMWIRATSSGTYSIDVRDHNNDEAGYYTISLILSGGNLTTSAGDQGGTIIPGTTIDGSFHQGDTDGWTFHANQGDYIAISAGDGAVIQDSETYTGLASPSGALIKTTRGGRIWENAPETGYYTILISDFNNDDAGNYQLSLVVSGGEMTISEGDQGGPISSGVPVTGDFNQGDTDGWYFTADQGAQITVFAEDATADSPSSPYYGLINPSGRAMGLTRGGTISKTADETGIYTIVISDFDNNDMGDYKLTVTY